MFVHFEGLYILKTAYATYVGHVVMYPPHLQDVKIVRCAAGVGYSVFISEAGTAYWCGEGIGEMKKVGYSHQCMESSSVRLSFPWCSPELVCSLTTSATSSILPSYQPR